MRQPLLLYAARAGIAPNVSDNDKKENPIPATETEFFLPAETLHERYLDDVFRYVTRRVVRREEAEDITAEVFTAALTAWPRYQGRTDPYPWLLGVARRKIIDARRRQQSGRRFFGRREVLASETGDAVWNTLTEGLVARVSDLPETRALSSERQRVIRGLVEALKEEQREALLLRYVEDLPIQAVAAVLGKSPASVNSLLQRARQTLLEKGRSYFLSDFAEETT
ncbi:MAG: sigma-70 family RNA polymerase sigma factor [Cytophagales bacterium]|nr:sigma-70 family RNA polymerase sigma factor [Armatimonadota bacterium]